MEENAKQCKQVCLPWDIVFEIYPDIQEKE